MKFNDFLLIGFGGVIGYYLAVKKRKQVESALSKAQSEAKRLADRLEKELREGDRLADQIVAEDVQRDGL